MYTIELDTDPVELGFDPKEVKKNADGTYVVERKQYRVSRRRHKRIKKQRKAVHSNIELPLTKVAGFWSKQNNF